MNGTFGLTDVTLLGVRAGERALRRRGMMFREPWWFVSIKPGAFNLVHQHLFAVRQIGMHLPVVSTAGGPLSVRYRDAEHWSQWRVRRAVALEKTLSRLLRLHNPSLIGQPGNVLCGYSLKFWAFLVGHGAPPASTRGIGAGLQDLHLPPNQTTAPLWRSSDGTSLAARPLWHKEFSMTALHGDLLAAYAAVAPKHPVDVTKTTSVMPPASSHR